MDHDNGKFSVFQKKFEANEESYVLTHLQVVEYAAYQLLTSTDATTAGFKNSYDFYIFPIVNPDGFAYSQTTDRMWRKNRQTTPSASCVGRDINRKFPHLQNRMVISNTKKKATGPPTGTKPTAPPPRPATKTTKAPQPVTV